MGKRFVREDIDRFHDYGLYIPKRTIYMGSEQYDIDGNESGVDGFMAERFVKNMSLLNSASDEPITVIMNNPGGDWYSGMAIYDSIKYSKAPVTIKVYGMSMSMGAVILQAASERIMAPNARLMIHYGTMGLESTHGKIFDKWAKENNKLDYIMETIFFEKIKEKDSKFKFKKLKEMLNFDTILSAKEAVDLGLADKILGEEND